jgi:8-oxo-dGTP pyrophosphatase MutT (NUDIX family)
VTEWRLHDARTVYENDTVRVELADVELTDGRHVDHTILRFLIDVVALVIRDPDRGFLLLWRHRFITGRWIWDVPAGKVAPGERPEDGAARAALEETGWLPGPVRLLGTFHPNPGISDQRFGIYLADSAEQVAELNPIEAARVEWLSVDRVRQLLRDGEIDGLSLTALLWALAAADPR